MLNIIDAVDEKVKTVGCKKESKKGCTGKSVKCIAHNLWDDLENHINSFFEKNTLKDIIFKENKPQAKWRSLGVLSIYVLIFGPSLI